jgi:hypothetical protein
VNRALCYYSTGQPDNATRDLVDAQREQYIFQHQDPRYAPDVMRRAWESGKMAHQPFTVPLTELYCPPQIKVRNAERKDFLGTSKVIATVNTLDRFTGFIGPKVRI